MSKYFKIASGIEDFNKVIVEIDKVLVDKYDFGLDSNMTSSKQDENILEGAKLLAFSIKNKYEKGGLEKHKNFWKEFVKYINN